jgi:3-oxoadipate enol-lactonase
MSFVTTDDGVRLWYQIEGSAAAPVIVLSNSLGTDLAMWDAQLPALTAQFQVLRYDARGHGQSSVPPQPYLVDRLGRDVLALLDACGIARAHFCGLSMGGMTGMWLAREAPERIDRLALCNTAARIGPPEVWDKRVETVRAAGMAAIVPGVIERWFTAPFRLRDPEAVARIVAMLRATPPEGYVAACLAIRDMDQRDQLATIRARTLVIAGAADQATPAADGRLVAERIPGARFVELAAAHLSNIEAADDFTAALLGFLNSTR